MKETPARPDVINYHKGATETKLKGLKKNTLSMNGHIRNTSRKIKVYVKY